MAKFKIITIRFWDLLKNIGFLTITAFLLIFISILISYKILKAFQLDGYSYNIKLPINLTASSSFGTLFSGIITPIISLASVLLFYNALLIQKKELKLTNIALKEQYTELVFSRMNNAYQRYILEYKTIINNLRYDSNDIGVDALRKLNEFSKFFVDKERYELDSSLIITDKEGFIDLLIKSNINEILSKLVSISGSLNLELKLSDKFTDIEKEHQRALYLFNINRELDLNLWNSLGLGITNCRELYTSHKDESTINNLISLFEILNRINNQWLDFNRFF